MENIKFNFKNIFQASLNTTSAGKIKIFFYKQAKFKPRPFN
jgi:hypothetical protein